MRIGVLGSGNMGGALTLRLTAAGHEVAVANSRGPGTLTDLVDEAGERARAATVSDAAAFGEVVFLAVPYKAAGEVLDQGAPWEGKIVVDLTNYYERRDGAALAPPVDGSSTVIAALAAPAHVVKAFNTIWSRHLLGDGGTGGRGPRAIPLAGDDAEAKRVVGGLIEDIGFAPVDIGDLADGVRQEPDSSLFNRALTTEELRERL